MAKKTAKKASKKTSKPHVTKGSVFDDLGLSPEVSEAVKIKAELYDRVLAIIKKNKYTPKALEGILSKPQPRVSELLNGKISKLSIEKLLEYLSLLGATVSVKVKEGKAA